MDRCYYSKAKTFCLGILLFEMGGHVRLKVASFLFLTIFSTALSIGDVSSSFQPSLFKSGRSISSSTYYPLNSINHKTCHSGNEEGVCMFVWECMRNNGKHSGMCMEGFMFLSCCTIEKEEEEEEDDKGHEELPKPQKHQGHSNPYSHSESNSINHYKPKVKPGSLLRPMYASSSSNSLSQQLSLKTSSTTQSTTKPTTTTTSMRLSPTTPFLQSNMFPLRDPFNTVKEQTTSTTTVRTNSLKPQTTAVMIIPPVPPTRPTRPPKPTRPTRPTVTPWWLKNQFLKLTSQATSSSTTTTTSTTTTATTTTTTTTTTPKTTTIKPVSITPKSQKGPITTNAHSKHICGTRKIPMQPEGRIVNGTTAKYGEFPWQVSVRRTSFFGFSSAHRCGGALLNSRWVATAGHCVDDLLTSQIRLRVGEFDFSSVMEPFPYTERKASKKIVHPKYNFFTYEHDLALIEMESGVEFQVHIQPICLPANGDLLVGEMATVTGWGRLSEHGTLPSILQHATVPIMSNDICKNMFLKAGRKEHIPEIFLCAGYPKGGRDSCQGDSGGPLQAKGRDGRWFLAGIISWGIGCAEPNLPGVCTRISEFVPWILEHVSSS